MIPSLPEDTEVVEEFGPAPVGVVAVGIGGSLAEKYGIGGSYRNGKRPRPGQDV